MIVNDLAWLSTAIACAVMDEPPKPFTYVVAVTTAIYAADLAVKFHRAGWKPRTCLRLYWLDIVLLIPFVKLFRGLRIVKVGMLLRGMDAACDFTELACRFCRFVRRIRTSGTVPPGEPGKDPAGGDSENTDKETNICP